jgi:CRP/FNR family cyclic AMP-dependent transcriptional regulator
MQSSAAVSLSQEQFEDPLAYLPFSTMVEYQKGATIYGPDRTSTGLYLVIEGRVKVSRLSESGHQFVIDIYRADDFFGESAFLNLPHHCEQATAIETAKVMSWQVETVTDLMMRRPRLAFALLQVLARRGADMKEHVVSLCMDTMTRRLARALLRFSLRMGTVSDGGALCMAPFTHELLAQYVGTSREIVTYYMNQLRREGYLQYSRRGVTVFPDALRHFLRSQIGPVHTATSLQVVAD